MSETTMGPQAVHEILARDFTDRYIQKVHLEKLAYSAPYDPNDPISDYNKTWWEAKPNGSSVFIGETILSKTCKVSRQEINDTFVSAFFERAGDMTQALTEYPLMMVNGHSPDLQAALASLSASKGIAQATHTGDYQRTLQYMIERSHGIATRGLVPMVISPRKAPFIKIPFIRLQQLVVNPHLSFPINEQMLQSGIPKEFKGEYNSRLRAENVAIAQGSIDDPAGYRTLWSIAPSGTPDVEGEDEHEGKTIAKEVVPATIRMIGDMGCGLLPVYTKFGGGESATVLELGSIIPPDEVTEQTVPTIMADLAEFRRKHGQTNVYYEGELDLLAA